MPSTITDTPRSIAINGISFSVAEVEELGTYFTTLDLVVLAKEVIRETVVLQKALAAAVVVNKRLDAGNTTTLNLTQDGRALLGTV